MTYHLYHHRHNSDTAYLSDPDHLMQYNPIVFLR